MMTRVIPAPKVTEAERCNRAQNCSVDGGVADGRQAALQQGDLALGGGSLASGEAVLVSYPGGVLLVASGGRRPRCCSTCCILHPAHTALHRPCST